MKGTEWEKIKTWNELNDRILMALEFENFKLKDLHKYPDLVWIQLDMHTDL